MNTLRFVALFCALTLSGCAGLPSFGGQADTAAPETEAAADTTDTTSPKSKMPWPNPCSVYDAEKELTDYQFKQEKEELSTCYWKQDDDAVLEVTLYRDMGLGVVPEDTRSKVSDISVGSRSGVLVEKANGGESRCKVAVSIEDGQMYVTVRTDDLEKSCELAKKVVEQVEPSLPGGK